MPNAAAAQFDDDFDIVAPARKKAPRRSAKSGSPRSSGKRKKTGRSRFHVAVDMHRVARYGAVAISATVAVGILVNALMMQTGHHPAPLFGKSIALGQTAAKSPAQPAAALKKAEAVPAPVERPRADAPASREPDAAPQKTSDDAIGRLLQGGPGAADKPTAKTVLGVQRALAKIGMTVKQTGTFGPQTRKAIEHFEKDHHLPVNGEISRRVVKLLASQSGLKIEQ